MIYVEHCGAASIEKHQTNTCRLAPYHYHFCNKSCPFSGDAGALVGVMLGSVRPKAIDRRGVKDEGYLVVSLLQSDKVDLYRSLQRVRDHRGRRALVVEPDFEPDGRRVGTHGVCSRLGGVVSRGGAEGRNWTAGPFVRGGVGGVGGVGGNGDWKGKSINCTGVALE